MRLNDYVTLGRTGLRVSPLCFGAMTFGTEWGWGADETTSKQMFDRYLEVGGNFIDTADAYTNGHSEELVGKFVGDAALRDRMVIATKFTFNAQPGNPPLSFMLMLFGRVLGRSVRNHADADTGNHTDADAAPGRT